MYWNCKREGFRQQKFNLVAAEPEIIEFNIVAANNVVGSQISYREVENSGVKGKKNIENDLGIIL